MVPFAKTGGLADVTGALPYYLEKLKHRISVFLPLYKQIKESGVKLDPTDVTVDVKVGNRIERGTVWVTTLPDSHPPLLRSQNYGMAKDSKIQVYFIQHDEFYSRPYLYSTSQGDYPDNAERYIFFSRAVIEAIKSLKLKPDIIHCHEWQTALISVYLKTLYKKDPLFKKVKTVFTIHNLAYQGVFEADAMNLTELDKSLFNWKQLEFWGKINFLKGGLVFSDSLTTASPTYAKEIQTVEFGYGLEEVLKERVNDLYGILNGVDYNIWNPEIDKHLPDWPGQAGIPANFSADNLEGKSVCKKALQEYHNLPVLDVPLIGIVARLVIQKGLDILLEIFDELIKENMQFVVLGTGDEKYQLELSKRAQKYPNKMAVNITFDDRLAHLITAGADMFLMPSRYEPCGLNQLYSLKYGTVPIVRETGGLADTVINCQGDNFASATGFSFKDYSGEELLKTLKRAFVTYRNKKMWAQIIQNGMKQDWSWKRSADEYNKVYLKVKGKH